jgi:hypothetical protein
MVEGVFLEDLPGTDDPNDPSYARFQIKTSRRTNSGWADENAPSIIPVWNRSPNSATEGDFAFAQELYPDKWFWVSGGGASAGGFITFQPYEVVPGIGSICDAVQAIVLSSECGSGIQEGDVVNVWDRSRNWFAMPEDLLFASSGYAHYMKVSDAERYALGDLDPGPCHWEVINMNCIEDDYGVS